MSILIPIAILGVIMTVAGYYFATHEGRLQQAEPRHLNDADAVTLPSPPITDTDPSASHAEQPARGVPLHS